MPISKAHENHNMEIKYVGVFCAIKQQPHQTSMNTAVTFYCSEKAVHEIR